MTTVTIERPADRDDELKVRRGAVRFLRVPVHRFVMVDGDGPPVPEAFEVRIPGLYAMAYGLRFALKARGVERRVGPLEGLWWTTDGVVDLDAIFAREDRGTWRWTLMIVLPDEANDDELAEHLEAARDRLGASLAPSLRVERFEEGDVAQVLHVGPYEAERPSIERLHESIAQAGLHPTGRHHELYLGDPRRAAPDKLRTVLRMPVTT
jgi:hypothetical protein